MFQQEKKYYRDVFLFPVLISFVIFLPFVVADGGYFVFYGDYNAQLIPFYTHSVEMIRSGTLGWDWQTDIGVNFIGSYGMLSNPFIWIMCLFPSSWTPYLMMPLMCIKIGLFGLFGYIYVRRFVTKPQSAFIGGMLYAFSGFNLQSIFFQYQDSIVWFPLLLIALDEAVINKRRGVFALAMALNCIVSYFFFIQECVFLVLYFVVRCVTDPKYSVNIKGFICLAFESIVGVLIAGVMFFPSIYQVLDVPRVGDTLYGWEFLFYEVVQRYGLILESIFFPPEIIARSGMFPMAASKWSSVAIYLPLFSVAFVWAFFKNEKKHWIRYLLLICLLFAFIPGFNALFTMLNKGYYARWFYMPTLICCLATAIVLDHEDYDIKEGVVKTTVVTAFISAMVLFAPFEKSVRTEDGLDQILVPRFMIIDYLPLWVSIALAGVSLFVLFKLIKYRKEKPYEVFMERVTSLTVVFSMFLGYYFVVSGRGLGPNYGEYKATANAKVEIDDPEFYRMESFYVADDDFCNLNLMWGMSSLKSFISVIPGSSFEFYDLLRMGRTTVTYPGSKYYALRALTRVKYMIITYDPKEEKQSSEEKEIEKMGIYDYMETQGKYKIYKSDYALPIGFAYDSYYLINNVKGKKNNDYLMVRAAILTKEQAEKYSDILEPQDTATIEDVSIETLKKDATARIAEGVTEFSINKKGFTAVSNYDTEKLVCFSVPWSEGWSATVNGEPVEIDKINGGLCAICVPEGVGEISFTFETPWLRYGIIASLGGTGLLAAYMLFFRIRRNKRRIAVQSS